VEGAQRAASKSRSISSFVIVSPLMALGDQRLSMSGSME